MTDKIERPWVSPITRKKHPTDKRLVALSGLSTGANYLEEKRKEEKEVSGTNILYVLQVRRRYKGHWGEGAESLYRALIRALDLEGVEDELVELAKPKPGRKQERELAERIWRLKAEGKTVPQIRTILASEGTHKSSEAIASYLKARRKKTTRS